MFTFHLEVRSCQEREDRYVCTHRTGGRAGGVTQRTVYTCCPGARLVTRAACAPGQELRPVEETMEELGGGAFLQLLLEAGLDRLLENATVFLPSDETVEDWRREAGAPSGNTVYRVDDGLLGRRKRSLTVEAEGPRLEDVLAGHLAPGLHSLAHLPADSLLPAAAPSGPRVRITRYGARHEAVLANCARLTATDQHAANGLVHTVDRVLEPAQESILSILQADSQFTSLVSGLRAHGLADTLGEPGHFTLFAPTDEAFARLDPAILEQVRRPGGALDTPSRCWAAPAGGPFCRGTSCPSHSAPPRCRAHHTPLIWPAAPSPLCGATVARSWSAASGLSSRTRSPPTVSST
jgi:uncharacterized surface protein with fasciclin (FAS1) repeats